LDLARLLDRPRDLGDDLSLDEGSDQLVTAALDDVDDRTECLESMSKFRLGTPPERPTAQIEDRAPVTTPLARYYSSARGGSTRVSEGVCEFMT
jgi:hypothetical protein